MEQTGLPVEGGPEGPRGQTGPPAARGSGLRYDAVVVGYTPAGIAAVREAARLGARVALIRRGDAAESPAPEGIWAIERALRHAACMACRCPSAVPQGADAAARDLAPIEQAAGRLRAWLHPEDTREQLARAGVETYVGPFVFSGPDRLCGPDCELAFRKAILATGARLGPLEFEGAELALTDLAEYGEPAEARPAEVPEENAAAARLARRNSPARATPRLIWNRLPVRVAVVGGGPRACQWAQCLNRLGSQVTLISHNAALLPGEDSAARAVVQAEMERDGVILQLACRTILLDRTGSQYALTLQANGAKEKRFFDQVLAEAPLLPAVDGLELSRARIAFSEQGPMVDDRLRTTNRRVLAAGAVCGPHYGDPDVAASMGRLAAANALSPVASTVRRLDHYAHGAHRSGHRANRPFA